MALLWGAGLSDIVPPQVTVIGYTLGIPDVIMGITFLAAGTSVPDCMASLIVARQGKARLAPLPRLSKTWRPGLRRRDQRVWKGFKVARMLGVSGRVWGGHGAPQREKACLTCTSTCWLCRAAMTYSLQMCC